MPSGPDLPPSLQFPGWELHPHQRTLLVNGRTAKLGSRAFDVLLALALRPGRVVGKGELLAAAWPGRVVEENNLSVQIVALRKLLGADAIVNVSGIGYRLAASPVVAGAPAPASQGSRLAVGDGAAANTVVGVPGHAAAVQLLFGREADLLKLYPLLTQAPLVSLVGTGGVGKTALARALLAQAPPGDITARCWLDLAPLQRGAVLLPLLLTLASTALQGALADVHQLARATSDQPLQVVLDNCEHVLDEVGDLLSLVARSGAQLRWLATTREALRLPGEVVYRVAPLSVPCEGDDLDTLRHQGALAMFCQRVQAAGGLPPDSGDALAVAAEICRQLDGLPLALEIAAARVASLGLPTVQAQIAQRLRMRSVERRASPRQLTLQNAYAWSYELLAPEEQALFNALEPFVDGFAPSMAQVLFAHLQGDAAEADAWAVLDGLAGLVDKSLLQVVSGAGAPDTRLYLLESARDFARAQLQGQGRWDGVRLAHAHTVAAHFAAAPEEFEHLRDSDWSARYGVERGNVAAALAWVCAHGDAAPDGNAELLARLVVALGLIESLDQTVSELVLMPVALPLLDAAPPAWRDRARLELAWAHHQQGSNRLATELAQAALAGFEARQDVAGTHLALWRLMRMYYGLAGHDEAMKTAGQRIQAIDAALVPLRSRLSFEASAAYLLGAPRTPERLMELQRLAEGAGFETPASTCRVNLTDELLQQGRDEEVVRTARELLAQQNASPLHRALINQNLAMALVRLGQLDEARDRARQALRVMPSIAYVVLDVFASALVQLGRMEDAALVSGAGRAIQLERHLRLDLAEAALAQQTQRRLVEHFGAQRLDELMQLGALLERDAALELALQG